MEAGNIKVKVSYELIGTSLLLFHFSCGKPINHWMLFDLEEMSKQSGKSVEHLLDNLKRNFQKNE